MKILVVDDENIKRITLRDDISDAGYEVKDAQSAEEGLKMLGEYPADIVVTDLKMPGISGIEFMKKIKKDFPETYIILMTGYSSVETAVEAIREGAYDYLTKPFASNELIIVIKRIEELQRLKYENVLLRKRLRESHDQAIVGQSRTVQRLREQVQLMAQTDSPVMILGETGTGKDMVARMIHALGPRSQEPFVKVSCAMYSASVLESELFGYEKGAFTGADKARPGRFEAAENGTVYLDEVDDIPLDLQVKLLHVLEDCVIERVGGGKSEPFNARVVAASKQDLKLLVDKGRFRSDLFFRMNVLTLNLSPLRDFTGDIPYLIAHFLFTFGYAPDALKFSDSAMKRLMDYTWPGNVRELRNLVERLLFFGHGAEITGENIRTFLSESVIEQETGEDDSYQDKINRYEKQILGAALKNNDDNQSRAAASLKMKLSTFRDRLKKHNLV